MLVVWWNITTVHCGPCLILYPFFHLFSFDGYHCLSPSFSSWAWHWFCFWGSCWELLVLHHSSLPSFWPSKCLNRFFFFVCLLQIIKFSHQKTLKAPHQKNKNDTHLLQEHQNNPGLMGHSWMWFKLLNRWALPWLICERLYPALSTWWLVCGMLRCMDGLDWFWRPKKCSSMGWWVGGEEIPSASLWHCS